MDRLQVILRVLLLMCFIICRINCGPLTEFQLMTPYNKTEVAISSPPNSFSALKCARICAMVRDCTHFMWDHTEPSNGRFCQVWSETSGMSPPFPPSLSAVVYSKFDGCWAELGYETRNVGNTSVCVKWMNQPANFTEAENGCSSLRGLLFVANTQEKIELVAEMASENLPPKDATGPGMIIGIGLSDFESESQFVWSDGTVMTNQEGALFFSEEPNGGVLENWVGVYPNMSGSHLFDMSGGNSYFYVCEIR